MHLTHQLTAENSSREVSCIKFELCAKKASISRTKTYGSKYVDTYAHMFICMGLCVFLCIESDLK